MKCEVRNVQTSENWQIPPEGMIFGRAGGPANITVADQSVSKRHARIYQKDGQWFLEDLKSVNGTVVNNRRITEPMPLTPGFTFALSKHTFEIVSIDGMGAQPSPGTRSSARGGESDPNRRSTRGPMQAPPPTSNPNRRAAGGPSGQPVQVPDAEPLLPPEQSRSRGALPPPHNDYDQPIDPGGEDPYLDEAVQGGGASAVMAALPKAIAYYLAAIPLMALNPIGTIRKGVEEPKVKAMGPLELIAFSLPVSLFAALVTPIAAGIGTLVGGGGFVFGLFFPIGSVIGAIIGAVISGLIWHPVCKFFIDRLFKGESDDRTRTNYLVMLQTAVGITQIPAALSALLVPVIARISVSFKPAAFLQLIPALLTMIVMPLAVYVSWRWMQRFNVLAIVQKIFFVLVILACLGAVGTGVGTIVGIIRTITSGGSAVTIPDVPSDGDKPKDDGDKPKDDGDKPKDDGDKPKDDGDKPKNDGDKPKNDGDKPKDDGDKPKDDGDKPKDKPPVNVDPPRDDPPPSNTISGSSGKAGAFAEYKRKRDFVEKAVSENPAILLDNAKVGRLYQQFSREISAGIEEANDAVNKKERSELRYFLERYREAVVYKKTSGTVDKLYEELNK